MPTEAALTRRKSGRAAAPEKRGGFFCARGASLVFSERIVRPKPSHTAARERECELSGKNILAGMFLPGRSCRLTERLVAPATNLTRLRSFACPIGLPISSGRIREKRLA